MMSEISKFEANISSLKADVDSSQTTINILCKQQERSETERIELSEDFERKSLELSEDFERKSLELSEDFVRKNIEMEKRSRESILQLKQNHIIECEKMQRKFQEMMEEEKNKAKTEKEAVEADLKMQLNEVSYVPILAVKRKATST